jgi:hypothetical protein
VCEEPHDTAVVTSSATPRRVSAPESSPGQDCTLVIYKCIESSYVVIAISSVCRYAHDSAMYVLVSSVLESVCVCV